MAPPCVAFFEGDNGGETYQGVTGKEIRILLYVDGGGHHQDLGSRGAIERPADKYFDLAKPSENPQTEPYPVEAARLYQRYFNERYQTYGRFLHFFVYFNPEHPEGATAETTRAEAADNFAEVDPFAVLVYDLLDVQGEAYAAAMAQKGVLTFGGFTERTAKLFSEYPGQQWDYKPSVDQHVRQFADHVCSKVVDKPVAVSGNVGENGRPRRLGLIRVAEETTPSAAVFARKAKAAIEKCGGNFVAEVVQTLDGGVWVAPPTPQERQAMADFQNKRVTTVIWAEGYNNNYSNAAASIGYRPEWVIAGDRVNEDIATAKHQDQDVWRHAWVITNQVLEGPRRQEPCVTALNDVSPSFPYSDTSIPCVLYKDFRQLATGIQVAGPRLTPEAIDKGFHAIPSKPSTDPSSAACFYEVDDYTCVKDSVAMYWDPDARSPYNARTGCWRTAERGRRHLPGDWPGGNLDAQRDPANDPCNAYTTGQFLDPSPGPETPPTQ